MFDINQKRTTFNRLVIFICVFCFSHAHATNDVEEDFEKAWNNPAYTQVKLDDVNINKLLS